MPSFLPSVRCISPRHLLAVATLAFTCSGLTGINDASAAVYEYQGNPYTSDAGPYTTAMRITGTLTFAAELAPNLSFDEITSNVQAFSFSDGVHTIAGPTSDFFYLYVATDGNGDLTEWAMAFTQPNPPHAEDYQIEVINSFTWATVYDLATINTDPFPSAGSSVAGTLTLVPEPGSLALLSLGGLMLMRRRR